jgi:preprotein translocase subunit SecE
VREAQRPAEREESERRKNDVNREFKRRMRKEQRAQERQMARGGPRSPMPVQQRRERVGIRQYFREIQAELKRVMWPTSSEVITYSIVVVFVVTVLTMLVFVADLGFAQAIVSLFKPTGR